MIHDGIKLRLFKTFHFSKTVCPYIANCNYRLCNNTADNHCEYCHNEVHDKLYWRGYTRHYDGQMKQCRRKYPRYSNTFNRLQISYSMRKYYIYTPRMIFMDSEYPFGIFKFLLLKYFTYFYYRYKDLCK